MLARIKNNVIVDIIEQHAEEAAFLWTQRDDAAVSPDYTLKELADLDERVEAHIDGLRIAGDVGWEVCQEAVENAGEIDEGVVFAAAVIAFESGVQERIDYVLEAGCKSEISFREMVSAMGWMQEAAFHKLLPLLLNANQADHLRLGISGAAVRRVDIGAGLRYALEYPDDKVKARALRAVGELKRYDLVPYLALSYQDAMCEFWSAWSGVLLGEYAKLGVLQTAAEKSSNVQMHAVRMILSVADHDSAMGWLKSIAETKGRERLLLNACAMYGDPGLMPMLLEYMKNPNFARLAGYAFSSITGLDLVDEKLEAEWPEGFEAGPNDDPEHEEVGVDADEDLPWPDGAGLEKWWAGHQEHFESGHRYLVGEPLTIEWCDGFVGKQTQRVSAALVLALSEHDAPLVNIKAPGAVQYQWMAG